MRKITSAILIFILFFNLFGYRFVADYIQSKNDKQLVTSLDNNNFDESQLIELKIPVHLDYQTTWSDFERYDGEVELKGVTYKYVKRKVVNDTLILLCIPDQQKMKLQTAKNEFFKNTNDLSNNTSKKSDNSKTIAFKKLTSEYDEHSYSFTANGTVNIQPVFGSSNFVANLLSSPHISPEQPPERISA